MSVDRQFVTEFQHSVIHPYLTFRLMIAAAVKMTEMLDFVALVTLDFEDLVVDYCPMLMSLDFVQLNCFVVDCSYRQFVVTLAMHFRLN